MTMTGGRHEARSHPAIAPSIYLYFPFYSTTLSAVAPGANIAPRPMPQMRPFILRVFVVVYVCIHVGLRQYSIVEDRVTQKE
jgi:hypothetical protein